MRSLNFDVVTNQYISIIMIKSLFDDDENELYIISWPISGYSWKYIIIIYIWWFHERTILLCSHLRKYLHRRRLSMTIGMMRSFSAFARNICVRISINQWNDPNTDIATIDYIFICKIWYWISVEEREIISWHYWSTYIYIYIYIYNDCDYEWCCTYKDK